MARPSHACTTSRNDRAEATTMTRPLAQILASMISVGVSGITSRCSIVPCSRSRIRPHRREHGDEGDAIDELHHGHEGGNVEIRIKLRLDDEGHRWGGDCRWSAEEGSEFLRDDALDIAGAHPSLVMAVASTLS